MVIAAIVCVFVLVGVVNLSVWNSKAYGGAAIVSLLGLLAGVVACGGAIYLPPLVITALLLLVGTFVASARHSRVGYFRIYSVCAGAIGLIVGFGMSISYVRHLKELRQQYPMESLAPRLSYEVEREQQQAGKKSTPPKMFAPPPKGSPAWTNLADDEKETRYGWSDRMWALKQIHASTVDQFNAAPGFGVTRMSEVNDYWLKSRRKPAPSLTLPRDESSPTAPAGLLLTSTKPVDGSRSSWDLRNELVEVHRTGARDFLNPESFGWIVDRNHVAGFESHRFSDQFQPYFVNKATNDSQLELTRLELVSLLKFDTPKVYVSNQNLPRLDKVRETPTRTLDPFESAALALLENGEDFVFNEHGTQILAFGSLRAKAECLNCHEVQRGTLLGAFSYQFHRILPPKAN